MELIQIHKSKLEWHAVVYDYDYHYIFLLYINFRSYCSIKIRSGTEVPLFSTSKELKIIALLLLHKLRPKFSTSGNIHCDDTKPEIKAISSCWQFICLSNFTLRQMGMCNTVQNTVALLAAATEPHIVQNAVKSTADAIVAILLPYC
jgi:hypothetical protein